MRGVADVQPVLVDRRRELDGLEELAGGTREYREAIGGRIELPIEKRLNPLEILLERFTLR